MLRAVRFHAQLAHLGFSLVEDLLPAIRAQAGRLAVVSRERITQEMLRIFNAEKPSVGLLDLLAADLWEPIFRTPPVGDLLRFDALAPHFRKAGFGEPGPGLHLAAAETWWPGFRPEEVFVLERETKQRLAEARRAMASLRRLPALELAEKKEAVGSAAFPYAWAILRAESENGVGFLELPSWRKKQEVEGKLCPPPLLSGKDLLGLGFSAGPMIKAVLDEIRQRQWNEEISSKEEAIALAKSRLPSR